MRKTQDTKTRLERLREAKKQTPTYTFVVHSPYYEDGDRNNRFQLSVTPDTKVKDLKGVERKLITEAKRLAALRANKLDREIAELERQLVNLSSVLSKAGDMTFWEFALVYEHHVFEEAVPGLEATPHKRGQVPYYSSSYGDTGKTWARELDYLKVDENLAKDMLDRGVRRVERYNRTLKPGPLGTKKLKDLTEEDVFVKVLPDGRRVPENTPAHNYVRRVLKAAEDNGIITKSPASLRRESKKGSKGTK